jgi:hypothetical protein
MRSLQHAYDALCDRYRRTLDLLHQEEQRAADMALAATEPCEICEVYQHERDDALLELDEVRAALVWLERDFKVGS